MKFHPPFNSFGAAIFNDMQKIQEAIIGHYLSTEESLPHEFSPFCDCRARASFERHYSKFKYTHRSGVVLYGAPDEIFVLKNGDLCVLDHKTAHFKGKDDLFHDQYQVQVIGYADIAEGMGVGTVTLGGLLYWEIQRDIVLANPIGYYKRGIASVPFVPKPLEIEIDYTVLDPLLKEAKKIWNASDPPDGRQNCKDCKKLDLLFGIEQRITDSDTYLKQRYRDNLQAQKDVANREYKRMARIAAAAEELAQCGEAMFEYDGMFANWEYPEAETSIDI